MNINEFSNKILNNYDEKYKQTFVDPLTLLAVTSAIQGLIVAIKLFCEWKNSPELAQKIKEGAKNPLPFIKLFIRRKLREAIGIKDYKEYGQELQDQIIQQCSLLSIREIQEILDDQTYQYV